jgi:cytochrome c-type biogenesis protein
LAPYRRIFEMAGGVTLIASGLYMLNAYFFWVPALAM